MGEIDRIDGDEIVHLRGLIEGGQTHSPSTGLPDHLISRFETLVACVQQAM